MLLVIDNYDSFTHNLVQRLGELNPAIEMVVHRNDQITVDEAETLSPRLLLVSPGPCTPLESGVSGAMIERFRGRIPILGVCLGHQAMAHAYGLEVHPHTRLMHGKTSEIHHDGRGVFEGLTSPFTATRYHSLIVNRDSVSDAFEISAWTDEGEIMGLRWCANDDDEADLEGVQFHPESFLTIEGPRLLENFLRMGGMAAPATPA